MAVKMKPGAGTRDLIFCDSCRFMWSAPVIDLEWPENPENARDHECPRCCSKKISRDPAR